MGNKKNVYKMTIQNGVFVDIAEYAIRFGRIILPVKNIYVILECNSEKA